MYPNVQRLRCTKLRLMKRRVVSFITTLENGLGGILAMEVRTNNPAMYPKVQRLCISLAALRIRGHPVAKEIKSKRGFN